MDNIRVLPMISDEDMISYLKGAAAALFLSWYEGFGLPVLEAMACEVPVICSNQASLPEVAGNAAVLLRPDDTSRIVETIRRLYESPDFRQDLIKQGNQNIKRYSWENCADNVVKALIEHDA
jgi:glycosyltransferase involved in cell wall biosynthesis